MKNKFIALSLLLASCSTMISAQEKYSSTWKDNYFLSIGVGGQACVNPDNRDYGLGKTITPVVTLSFGKLITPVWGVRLQADGWQSKLYTDYMMTDKQFHKRKESYIGLNLDGMVNFTNWIGGYKPNRLFEFSGFIGPRVNFVKNDLSWKAVYKEVTQQQGNTTVKYKEVDRYVGTNNELRCLVGASIGLQAKFNINNYWAIDVEARGWVSPSIFGCYSNAKTDGQVNLTVGGTYTFGGKKFTACADLRAVEAAANEKINRLREELASAPTKQPRIIEKIVEKEVVKETEVPGPRAIFFEIGKAKISQQGMVNVKLAAEIMKKNPDKKYKLAGYADQGTGNAQLNERLSKERAQAVYDALVKEGVSGDQLEVVPMGGQPDLFFDNAALNRVVILE